MAGDLNRLGVALAFMEREEALFMKVIQNDKVAGWFSLAHWRFLMKLWSMPDRTTTQTKAKSLFDMEGYKSDNKRRKAINDLRRAGLIVRLEDEKDERIKLIALAPAAEEKIETYLGRLAGEIRLAARKLSD